MERARVWTVRLCVSIHAPVRARQDPSAARARPKCFNSRAREGATAARANMTTPVAVSIHAPVRARLQRNSLIMKGLGFNSRAREGATRRHKLGRSESRSFNSRAREGATQFPRRLTQGAVVSIHAPVRARPSRDEPGRSHRGFNSRAREGATPRCQISSD